MNLSRREHLKWLLAGAAGSALPEVPEYSLDATGMTDHDRRIQWWREAKFGMFVHWGLYSILGREAWAMGDEDIPLADYEKLAGRFQPTPNSARAWARLARDRARGRCAG